MIPSSFNVKITFLALGFIIGFTLFATLTSFDYRFSDYEVKQDALTNCVYDCALINHSYERIIVNPVGGYACLCNIDSEVLLID